MRFWKNSLECILILTVAAGCATTNSRTLRHSARTASWIETDFSHFTRSESAGAITMLSPELGGGPWNEMIVSWNAACPPKSRLVVEARAYDGVRWTRYYTLGIWSEDNTRQSVRGQKDADASVSTDTLLARRSMQAAQIRITFLGEASALPSLKLLSASFLNSRAAPTGSTRTNTAAWGQAPLDVPQRSQLGWQGASGWCSPTSLSMILAYWARQLHRPEMDLSVPAVAGAVYDPAYGGTGNWAFNMAFAGNFPGLCAWVDRFDEIAQVEDLVAAGVPVALSVSFDLLNGKEKDMGNGHLIVVVGFTASGDVIVNDPWPNPRKENSVRKVFPRAQVESAWRRSQQTVYIVKPKG